MNEPNDGSKKYICIGGQDISRKSGKSNYISPRRLPMLYGVTYTDCVFIHSDAYAVGLIVQDGQRILRPLQSGNYPALKKKWR